MIRSVFAKLILVLVAMCLVVNLFLFFGGRLFMMVPHNKPDVIGRNIDLYLDRLIADLGEQPKEEAVKRLAEETGLGIRIETPHGAILSEPDLPDPSDPSIIEDRPPPPRGFFRPPPFMRDLFAPRSPPSPSSGDKLGEGQELRPGHRRPRRPRIAGGRPMAERRVGNNIFYFFGPPDARFVGRSEYLIAAIAFVTLLFLAVCLTVRRILYPLRDMMAAVTAVGGGDLSHRMTIRSRDDFARLGRAFNDMSDRIADMVTAKERLLVDVSHELRSPLTRMKMALTLLQDDKGRGRLERDVSLMEQMVNTLLESARLERSAPSLERQDLDMNELVAECCELYNHAQPGLRLIIAPHPAVAPVDRLRVYSVLTNVLDNALKYSVNSQEPVQVRVLDTADGVVIHVRDFGVGISTEDLPRIGEPFFRVDVSRSKETGGFGLGLSLCKRIMAAHGGQVTLHQPDDGERGTLVVIYFPKAMAA